MSTSQTSRFWTGLLGVVSLIPLLLCGAFYTVLVFIITAPPPHVIGRAVSVFPYLFAAVAFLHAVLELCYIIHACKNSRIDTRQRIQWGVVFLLASSVAIPLYWYWYLWKQQPGQSRGLSTTTMAAIEHADPADIWPNDDEYGGPESAPSDRFGTGSIWARAGALFASVCMVIAGYVCFYYLELNAIGIVLLIHTIRHPDRQAE